MVFEIVLDESIFSATGDNDKLPEITQAVYWEHPFPVGGNPTQWRSAIYHEFWRCKHNGSEGSRLN